MLGKLLKYDLKWVYKVVGIFYILAIIFSIIGRALNEIENSLVFSIITALITILTTTVVIIGCLFICYYSEANMEALKIVLELAASTYNTTILKLLLLVSIVIFLEIIFIVLIGYDAIILGYKSNNMKMVKTLVIGFALYMLTQVITLGIIFVLGLFNPSVMNLINTTDIINIDAIKSVMYMGIGIYVAYIIFYYILGNIQLKKGVNVD